MSDPSEATPRRRRQSTESPPPAGSAWIGALIVVVALAIGFFLLRDDSSEDVATGPGSEINTEDDATPETEPIETTTTASTPAVRPASEVKVKVANGSGEAGAAGRTTDALKADGYVTGTPADAPDRVPSTIVYWTEGFEAEAAQVAESLGVGETGLQMMPTPAPVGELEESNILVVVGPDIVAPS